MTTKTGTKRALRAAYKRFCEAQEAFVVSKKHCSEVYNAFYTGLDVPKRDQEKALYAYERCESERDDARAALITMVKEYLGTEVEAP